MNRIFFKAITGEICLFIMHGIRPRAYNPIALFKSEFRKETGMSIKNSRHAVMGAIKDISEKNGLPLHPLFDKAMNHLNNQSNEKTDLSTMA